MPGRIGIAQVVHSLEIGGMERVALSLAARMDRSRYHPLIVCLTIRGDYADEAEAEGVEVLALGKQPGIDLRLPRRLARLMNERGVRIIHAHNSGPWFTGGLAVRWGSLDGFVITDHARAYPERWRRRVAERWLASRGHVVSVSEHNRQLLAENIGIPARKITVVPNGVPPPNHLSVERLAELRQLSGIQDGDVVVLNVARIEDQKAHHVLVDAAAILRDRGVHARFVIVGFGTCEDALKEQIKALNLSDRFTMTGKRTDAPDFYHVADIFALSSDWEGLPMSVLEAMGCSLPVVATKVGDMHTAVVEGDNGFLREPRDPRGLADALEPLIVSAERRKTMGAASRVLFDREFHVDRMVERYTAIYEACL